MVKSSLGVIILSTLLDPSASAPLYLPFVSVSQSDPRWLALNLDERTHLRQQHWHGGTEKSSVEFDGLCYCKDYGR